MSKATEFVRGWMDAVCRGDLDALASMTHEGSVHNSPDGNYVGPAGVRDLFHPILEATSERKVQINNLLEDGDSVVVEFVFRFINSGPMVTPESSIPATGKAASVKSIAIYELRDGKLAGSRGMYDRLDLLAQLGLLTAPAQLS